MDKDKITAFTLLDLSSAFDTIDHNILIRSSSVWHGIYGTALRWFSSYLTDIYKRVKIANCFSAALPTSCGVPQGSVLGPLLFCYSLHYSTKLSHSNSQLGQPPICRLYTAP